MTARNLMIFTVIAIASIMALSACSNPFADRAQPVRTIEVAVPTLELRPVPEELLRVPLIAGDLPFFYAPTTAGVSSCLMPVDEAKLRMLLIDRESRLDAWEKWGVLPE